MGAWSLRRNEFIAESIQEALKAITEAENTKPSSGAEQARRFKCTNKFPARVDLDTWTLPYPVFETNLLATNVLFWRAYKRTKMGFAQMIVYGEPGVGKSVYALYVAHEIHAKRKKRLPLRRIIDKFMVFEPRKLAEKIEKASHKRRITVLIGDDFGVTGSSRLFFLDRKLYVWLQNLVDVIRTRIGVMITTTPTPAPVMKVFGRLPGTILAYMDPGKREYEARVSLYETKLLPTGQIVVKKIGYDHVCTYLPDNIYSYYIKIRDDYANYVLSRQGRAFEKYIQSLTGGGDAE